jgi:hypothetical protein
MATVQVISEVAGLEDLVTAGKAFLMMVNKDNIILTPGAADDELGRFTNDGGTTWVNSATFVPGTPITGKSMVMVRDDSTTEAIRVWPAAAIPTGSKVTACVKYLEHAQDDGDSVDNSTGKSVSYYKYTFTY